MSSIAHVSVHGGHSGQFCLHATDSLEAVVQRYLELGFAWVGITEHTPPEKAEFRYRDEIEAGLSVSHLQGRFHDYMRECRRLQHQYRGKIEILAAMEVETYEGYETLVPRLIDEIRPDYIVGSVHFIDTINFDYSPTEYDRARHHCGSLENLYCRYFDLQHDMIMKLQPAVVGHFDLIRLFDPDYPQHLKMPAVWQRIRRNLELIKQLELILDFNLRALLKGATEPYISRPILQLARELGIAVVPGDDSHGVSSVGGKMDLGIDLLLELGLSTDWQKPKLYR